MFDKVKNLIELKRQADAIKKELSAEILEIEQGAIKVVVSADMKIHSLEYPVETNSGDLVKAINKAIEEAQKIAAKKMQGQLAALGDLLK